MRQAFVYFFCLVFLQPQAIQAQSTPQPSQNGQEKAPPDLTGRWKTADGRKLAIAQTGAHLHATFLSGDDQCANGATLNYVFDGGLKGPSWTSLSGLMTACTDQKLANDCHFEKVWETRFEAAATLNQISGKVLITGLRLGNENGHYVNCHIDSRYDSYQDFVLTLDCDPTIAALRQDEDEAEKEAARRFAHSANLMHERTEEAQEDYWDWAKELGLDLGIHTGAEQGLDKTLEHLDKKLLEKLSTPTSDLDAALKTQKQVTYVEGTAPYVRVASEAALWATLAIATVSAGQMIWHLEGMYDEAKQEASKAEVLLRRSVADFRRILDLLAACRKQYEQEEKRLHELQDLDDRAHKLMDKWDLGTGLYRDGSGQLYDAGGALKRAKEIVLSGQSSRRNTAPSHRHMQLQPVAFGQPPVPQQTITISSQQLKDALAQINSAKASLTQGMDKLEQAAAVDEDIHRALEDLVSRLGPGPEAKRLTPSRVDPALAATGMRAKASRHRCLSKGYPGPNECEDGDGR